MRLLKLVALPLGLLLAAGCQPKGGPERAADIQRLGGEVEVDGSSPGKPVVAVNLSQTGVTDADLACLEGLTELQTLHLAGDQVAQRLAQRRAEVGLTSSTGLNIARGADSTSRNMSFSLRLGLTWNAVKQALGRASPCSSARGTKGRASLCRATGVPALHEEHQPQGSWPRVLERSDWGQG